MLRKWALFHASGGMRRIKVRLFYSYFWGRQFFYNFLPLQVVKTGGHEKKTVLVNSTFSIFCGQPNLFLRNQHCLSIASFVRKPGVCNSDPCFSLRWNSEKNVLSLFRKQGSEFRTLAFRSAEIVKKKKKKKTVCFKSKGPNFGPLLFAPLK